MFEDDAHGDSHDLVIIGKGTEPESNVVEGHNGWGGNRSDLMGGGVEDGEGGVVAEAKEAVAGIEDLDVEQSDVGEMRLVDEVVVGSNEADGEGDRWRLAVDALEEKGGVAGGVLQLLFDEVRVCW